MDVAKILNRKQRDVMIFVIHDDVPFIDTVDFDELFINENYTMRGDCAHKQSVHGSSSVTTVVWNFRRDLFLE